MDSNFYNMEIIKGIEKDGDLYFAWKKIEELKELDIRPKIIKKLLCDKSEGFFHIISKN